MASSVAAAAAPPNPAPQYLWNFILECPICTQICLPPVLQCVNGHLVCNGCISRLAEAEVCPTCRHGGPFGRCLVADRLLALVDPIVVCPFLCGAKLQLSERLKHETKCLLRPLSCPAHNCHATCDDGARLFAHFRETHAHRVVDGNDVYKSLIDLTSGKCAPKLR
jgi:hypothetical protein